jgi:hypothetical protein
MGIDTDAMRARLRSYRQSGFPNYCMALDEVESLLLEIEKHREDAVVYRSVETSLKLQAEELQTLAQRMREVRKSAVQAAVAEERAAVVAWLRTVAPNAPTRRGADELAWCANAIERGEHRREEKP